MAFSIVNPQTTAAMRGCSLDPLAQRLLLYRFASVHLQPEARIEPLRWGLPYLQRLAGASGHWQHVFDGCLPFRELGEEPVISPSLSALLAVRKRQPRRPLIHCIPAFAKQAQTHKLAQLPRRFHFLASLLDPRDATQPLLWAGEMPRRLETRLLAYSEATHPLEKLRKWRQQANPHSLFTWQEDGQLLEQLGFGSSPFLLNRPPALVQSLASLELKFSGQIGRLQGTYYVFSSDWERLAWFQRDCLRLLPHRFRCLHYSEEPHPQDPFVHFVLVHDPQVLMRRVRPEWKVIHLEGDLRRFLFRACRQAQGPPRWQYLGEVSVDATYPTPEGLFRFRREPSGWFCLDGGTHGRDGSSAFSTRVLFNQILRS